MKYLRERLQFYGPDSLTSEELLCVLLKGSPAPTSLLQRLHTLLFAHEGNLADLLRLDFGQLCREHRLGPLRAAQLVAVFELAKRLHGSFQEGSRREHQIITQAEDAAKLVIPDFLHLDHEEMRVLVLSTKNQVICNLLLYKGTVNATCVRASELLKPAITRNCPSILVCHSHPSGDPTPSPEDLAFTRQLVEAGKLLDISVLDHLVIGGTRFCSIRALLQWQDV